MLHAHRDKDGEITAIYAVPRPGTEPVAQEDPALGRFLTSRAGAAQIELARSDLTLARVLEDLVALLVDKKVIRLGELPPEAQSKLLQRKRLRGELAGLGPFGPLGDKLI